MKKLVLLDSNIIIYSVKPEYECLRHFIKDYEIAISAISIVEVLGYHLLGSQEKIKLERLIGLFQQYPVSNDIIQKATELRQHKKMSVGDSIILATAILYGLPLMTRNIKDFDWVTGVQLINPFDQS